MGQRLVDDPVGHGRSLIADGIMSSSSTAAAIDASAGRPDDRRTLCVERAGNLQTDTSRRTGDQNTSRRQIHPPTVAFAANGGRRTNPLAGHARPSAATGCLLPHAESVEVGMHLMRTVASGHTGVHVDRRGGIWEFAAPDLTRASRSPLADGTNLDSQHRFVASSPAHWWLWMRMAQQDLRYDTRPMGKNKRLFLFDDQVDNLTLTSGRRCSSALWESVGWWAYANDIAPMITWGAHLVHRAVPARAGVVDRVLLGDALAASPWPRLHPRALVAPQERQRRALVGPCDTRSNTSSSMRMCCCSSCCQHIGALPVAMMHHSSSAPMSPPSRCVAAPWWLPLRVGGLLPPTSPPLHRVQLRRPESPLDTAINAWHDGTEEGEQATAARRGDCLQRSGLAEPALLGVENDVVDEKNLRVRLLAPAARIHPSASRFTPPVATESLHPVQRPGRHIELVLRFPSLSEALVALADDPSFRSPAAPTSCSTCTAAALASR